MLISSFCSYCQVKPSVGPMVSTFAGSGEEGSTDAKGILASFRGTIGVAVDVSGNVYVVKAGDSLYNIAKRYGTSVPALCQKNGLNTKSVLHLGQKIKV